MAEQEPETPTSPDANIDDDPPPMTIAEFNAKRAAEGVPPLQVRIDTPDGPRLATEEELEEMEAQPELEFYEKARRLGMLRRSDSS